MVSNEGCIKLAIEVFGIMGKSYENSQFCYTMNLVLYKIIIPIKTF